MLAQFNFPTTILFGTEALGVFGGRVAERHGNGPVLLVTDEGLVRAGIADRVRRVLEAAGVKVELFAEVHPNPVEADVVAGARRYRDTGCTGVVGLGGGSPLDAAKVVAVLATHEGSLLDFDAMRGGDARITSALAPVYAIPTTAGTGSEVGRSAVVIAEATKRKTIVFHPTLMPRIAVLAPELTVGLPPHLTAATGFDALTHAVEAYLSVGYHPMADAIALGAIELVVAHLPTAVADGGDLEARGHMLVAATMGATAFQKGLGVVHSLAHPLSTRYGTHHGLANALLLPGALAWQLAHERASFTDDLLARYRRIARILDPGASADDLPGLLADFRRRVGITETLAETGATHDDVPALADEAYDDPCHRENPITLSRDDLAAIYRSLLDATG